MRYHEFKVNENVVQKVKDKVVNDFKRRKELFGKGKKPKKNVAEGMEARIQHLEDLVYFEGSKGAASALEGLRSLEKGGHVDATIKWDGSPAIIASITTLPAASSLAGCIRRSADFINDATSWLGPMKLTFLSSDSC